MGFNLLYLCFIIIMPGLRAVVFGWAGEGLYPFLYDAARRARKGQALVEEAGNFLLVVDPSTNSFKFIKEHPMPTLPPTLKPLALLQITPTELLLTPKLDLSNTDALADPFLRLDQRE
jgi:hypothetical protein